VLRLHCRPGIHDHGAIPREDTAPLYMKWTAVADRSRFGLRLTLQYIENIVLLANFIALAAEVRVSTAFNAVWVSLIEPLPVQNVELPAVARQSALGVVMHFGLNRRVGTQTALSCAYRHRRSQWHRLESGQGDRKDAP